MESNMNDLNETTQVILPYFPDLGEDEIGCTITNMVLVEITPAIKEKILNAKAWLYNRNILRNHKILIEWRQIYNEQNFISKFTWLFDGRPLQDPVLFYKALQNVFYQKLFTILNCDVYVTENQLPHIIPLGD